MAKLQRFIQTKGGDSPIGEGNEYEWQTVAEIGSYTEALHKVKLFDQSFTCRFYHSDTCIILVHEPNW